jgi:hypothetical protein
MLAADCWDYRNEGKAKEIWKKEICKKERAVQANEKEDGRELHGQARTPIFMSAGFGTASAMLKPRRENIDWRAVGYMRAGTAELYMWSGLT